MQRLYFILVIFLFQTTVMAAERLDGKLNVVASIKRNTYESKNGTVCIEEMVTKETIRFQCYDGNEIFMDFAKSQVEPHIVIKKTTQPKFLNPFDSPLDSVAIEEVRRVDEKKVVAGRPQMQQQQTGPRAQQTMPNLNSSQALSVPANFLDDESAIKGPPQEQQMPQQGQGQPQMPQQMSQAEIQAQMQKMQQMQGQQGSNMPAPGTNVPVPAQNQNANPYQPPVPPQ